jgi:dihydroorotate dehydrogenase electron transfer subunit
MEEIELDDKLKYITCKVYNNTKIQEGIYKIEFLGKFSGNPGQFYMLRAWETEPVLSRPISINYIGENKISFLYQVVGRGTNILSKLEKGDSVKLMGPLGNGFNIDTTSKKIAIVSGGIGIAPMLYLAKTIDERSYRKHIKLDLYAGFKKDTYILDEFEDIVDNIYYTVETGETGVKGYVTDIFKPESYDEVLCCGPEKMMVKVVKMCREKSIPVYVSMESRMACGIGACLVCTCKTKNGNKRTCCDGPVFPGKELIL